jgi:hypothetical protein
LRKAKQAGRRNKRSEKEARFKYKEEKQMTFEN